MKLTSFYGALKRQGDYNVPFQAVLPLKLKKYVSGKNQQSNVDGCLFEVTMILSCLQEHEFETKFCKKQIDALDRCYDNFKKASAKRKADQKSEVLVANSSTQTHKQITSLLKSYYV